LNETFTTPPVPAGNPAADGSCPANQIFTMPSGQQTCSISTSTYFGSNQYAQGLPLALTCDPRKGLGKGQYFNPNCFAVPLPPSLGVYGQQGPDIWPYIRNPHYFGSDLAIFKAFKITESQRFEVRISATNWLNHPNAEFGESGNSDQQLVFSGISTGSAL
jgi:hypothetical protein